MQKFFLLLFVVWSLYNMCIHYVKLFFVLSLQYFEEVFVCCFLTLFLCCFCFVVSAFICMFCIFYDLFHILLLPLQTYGSMKCKYTPICIYGKGGGN
jgi:hypothetical protein